MAITLVGIATGKSNNGGDVTITLPSMQENDLVVVSGGFPRTGDNDQPLPTTAGYTTVTTVDDGTDGEHGVAYKFMGATPDTTVTGSGSGNSQDATNYIAVVLRGVDQTTPQDTTATTATGSGSNGNNPSITTVTDGAWVIAHLTRNSGNDAHDPANTAPSGYSNLTSTGQIDTNRHGAHVATKEVATAGADDPSEWGFSGTSAWIAITSAWRPAAADVVVTPDPVAVASSAGTQSALHTPGAVAVAATLLAGAMLTGPPVVDVTASLPAASVAADVTRTPAPVTVAVTGTTADVVRPVVSCSAVTGALHDEFVQLSDVTVTDIGDGVRDACSQSWTSSGSAEEVSGVCWRARRLGSPTGYIQAAIYAHSGVKGTSSVPTGSALVASAKYDVASMDTTFANHGFPLSGWTWAASTDYTVVLDASNVTGDGSNRIEVVHEAAGDATHAGNMAAKNVGGGWVAQSTIDMPFKVYVSALTASAVSVAASVPAPSQILTPAAVTVAASIAAASEIQAPPAVSVAASLPAASVAATVTRTPAAVSISVLASDTERVFQPVQAAATASAAAPSEITTPVAASVTSSLPAASIGADVTATPAAVSVASSVAASSHITTPSAVVATSSVQASSHITTPAVVAVTSSVPAASVAGEVILTPSAVAVAASIAAASHITTPGAASVAASSETTDTQHRPDPASVAVSLPAATVAGTGTTLTPAAVSVASSVAVHSEAHTPNDLPTAVAGTDSVNDIFIPDPVTVAVSPFLGVVLSPAPVAVSTRVTPKEAGSQIPVGFTHSEIHTPPIVSVTASVPAATLVRQPSAVSVAATVSAPSGVHVPVAAAITSALAVHSEATTPDAVAVTTTLPAAGVSEFILTPSPVTVTTTLPATWTIATADTGTVAGSVAVHSEAHAPLAVDVVVSLPTAAVGAFILTPGAVSVSGSALAGSQGTVPTGPAVATTLAAAVVIGDATLSPTAVAVTVGSPLTSYVTTPAAVTAQVAITEVSGFFRPGVHGDVTVVRSVSGNLTVTRSLAGDGTVA